MIVTCPTCQIEINTQERCTSKMGIHYCMESQGHDGWHWTDVGGGSYVYRWTGVSRVRTCPGRINLLWWCEREPGHDGPHRMDKHGHRVSFWDEESEEVG